MGTHAVWIRRRPVREGANDKKRKMGYVNFIDGFAVDYLHLYGAEPATG
jgi:hypothetical protein